MVPEHPVEESNKEWYKWTYLQNQLTNLENKLNGNQIEIVAGMIN